MAPVLKVRSPSGPARSPTTPLRLPRADGVWRSWTRPARVAAPTSCLPLSTPPRGQDGPPSTRASDASNGSCTSTTVTPMSRPSVQAVMSYGRSMGAEGDGQRMSGYVCASSRSLIQRPNGCARRITAVPAGYSTPPAVNGAPASSTSAAARLHETKRVAPRCRGRAASAER